MAKLLLLLGAVGAFQAPAPRVCAPGACRVSAPRVSQTVRREAVPLAGVAAAALPSWRVVAAPSVLYALMSINEYITHRWYQHAEFNGSRLQRWCAAAVAPFNKPAPRIRGGGHVEHHAETLDDMSLKTDARWRSRAAARSLDEDAYRGTAFTWTVTAIMTGQMMITTLPAFSLMGFSLKATLACLAPAMLLHALVWNALHPNMHALPDVPLRDGCPSWVLAPLRKTWFFRFLYTNHEGHHVVGGRGNYNVACPGADHLLGTFVPEKVWRPQAKTTYASYHGEVADVEAQIAAHVDRERAKGLVVPVDLGEVDMPIDVVFDDAPAEKDLQLSR